MAEHLCKYSRDRIEDMRPTTVDSLVPIHQETFKVLRDKTTFIDLHRDPAHSVSQRCVGQSVERELVCEEMIPGAAEQPEALRYAVHVTNG